MAKIQSQFISGNDYIFLKLQNILLLHFVIQYHNICNLFLMTHDLFYYNVKFDR